MADWFLSLVRSKSAQKASSLPADTRRKVGADRDHAHGSATTAVATVVQARPLVAAPAPVPIPVPATPPLAELSSLDVGGTSHNFVGELLNAARAVQPHGQVPSQPSAVVDQVTRTIEGLVVASHRGDPGAASHTDMFVRNAAYIVQTANAGGYDIQNQALHDAMTKLVNAYTTDTESSASGRRDMKNVTNNPMSYYAGKDLTGEKSQTTGRSGAGINYDDY